MANKPSIILAPVDGSEGSGASAAYAADLAAALKVPLRLLYAFPKDPVDMFGVPTEAPTPKQLEYFSPDALPGFAMKAPARRSIAPAR